jgi:hypothetical protein
MPEKNRPGELTGSAGVGIRIAWPQRAPDSTANRTAQIAARRSEDARRDVAEALDDIAAIAERLLELHEDLSASARSLVYLLLDQVVAALYVAPEPVSKSWLAVKPNINRAAAVLFDAITDFGGEATALDEHLKRLARHLRDGGAP